ncbi:MAG: AmmeMemoRadiSam system radical SAM enzyme [Candidatus Omnitrophica bacterium]|nr:AmmeMemoRadiSam system radical SAM enzyme [Candidatus Omnitrophota bacterium]MBU4479000.1 AmmeMemoRadiSam system radical SAM enzyme [Candidatus Omnitrophota bacterium]MCG2703795.1 AmmeMemoRadiSam system radical SAM enzyme [Candidatus Omnitrophota bacterium]MCG2711294.1 AmmeMemoRadiSam system radical SAM enzyme [Candidatus Omnitrophota bacterium]
MHDALYYKVTDKSNVQCELCPKNCIIKNNNTGYCRSRKNVEGKLYSLIYGKTTGIALDPIEKKPLYHFHPGEMILSLGTRGCNFGCIFCQNWHISQDPDAYLDAVSPEQIISEALRLHSFGVAYTYNEPFIWYEFVLDTAQLAKKHGLANVLVSNGYVNPEPLEKLLPFIGAMNIDLKSMDDDFYKKICKGTLYPVLETIKRAKDACHVELTNLVIPTLNDSDEHFERLTDWVFDNTGADTPLHFSRYFPCYELNLPPTPKETLQRAYNIARKKLNFVYLGNV